MGAVVEDICCLLLITLFFFKILFREGKRRKKRGRETSMCGCLSRAPPTGGLTLNPGMYADWESNQWSFGLQAGTQSTEPHQPGHCHFKNKAGALTSVAQLVTHHPTRQKVTDSISQLGHMPGLLGRIGEATSWCFSLTSMFFSLFISLPSSLSKNK